MKMVICHLLFLLILALSYSFKPTEAASADVAKKAIGECIKEGGINGEDTNRIMADELFSPKYKEASEKLQCFLLCYYNKIGLTDTEGKPNPELFIRYLEERFADKKNEIRPSFNMCVNKKSTSPCKIVYELEGCVLKNLYVIEN